MASSLEQVFAKDEINPSSLLFFSILNKVESQVFSTEVLGKNFASCDLDRISEWLFQPPN